MSHTAHTGAPPQLPGAVTSTGPRYAIRGARHEDVPAVAAAVRELLVELDGTPPCASAMEDVTRTLIDSPWEGAVLVAQGDHALVGVIAASWQTAIHAPGAYALIQDLWVDPRSRGQAIGAGLIKALIELARSRHIERVEVGLPRESFARFGATEAFYLSNGFTPNGPRMRRSIS
jgi:GNAT superfamily N-acetyltransferase